MAVPGLDFNMPRSSPRTHPGRDVVAKRQHLSSWMTHDPKPMDPYQNAGGARSRAVAPITRVSAAPSKVVGGGTAEMNTAAELPGTTLYKPSLGEPQRANRRKGYFNNPDLDTPRAPPKGEPPSRNRKKPHSLGMRRTEEPDRIDPVRDGFGPIYSQGKRPNDNSFEHVKVHGVRRTDGVWAPIDKLDEGDMKQSAAREETRRMIDINAAKRAAEIAAKKAEILEEKVLATEYDPWSKRETVLSPQQRQTMARERRLLKNEAADAKRQANSLHKDAMRLHMKHDKDEDVYLRQQGRKLNKTSIEVSQQKFDEKVSKSTYVGQKLLKPGGGAPQLNPKTGEVQTAQFYDAETHLRNAYKCTQNSGDAVMTYSRREHINEHKENQKFVRSQMENDASRRHMVREHSRAEAAADIGEQSKLGVSGAGAPNVHPDGSLNARQTGKLDKPGEKIVDYALGQKQAQQIKEEEFRRKVDKIPHRYDKFELHDPYKNNGVVRTKSGKVPPRKNFTVKDVGMVAPDVVVEGATIANVMGKPGGGARSRLDTTHVAAAMEHEQFDREFSAQRKGESIFGKSGGGAPLRNADGTVNAKTRGRAELDKKGISDERGNPNYATRMHQIQDQQVDFMAQKSEWTKKTAADNAAADAKKAQETFMPADSNPHHQGKLPDRFIVQKKDLFGREKPPTNVKQAAALQSQVGARKNEEKRVILEDRMADNAHTDVASSWQGAGAGCPQVKDGEVTGKFSRDPDLHIDEHMENTQMHGGNQAAKKQYHAQLAAAAGEKAQLKKENKTRKAAEEQQHNAASHKHFNVPGGGSPMRTASGKINTKLGPPAGPYASEYKMLSPAASALA